MGDGPHGGAITFPFPLIAHVVEIRVQHLAEHLRLTHHRLAVSAGIGNYVRLGQGAQIISDGSDSSAAVGGPLG